MAELTGKKIEEDAERAVRAEYQSVNSGLSLGGLSVWTLTKRVWSAANEDNILDRAAELAYYFLFALFPGLIFLSAMFGLFASTKTQSSMELMLYMRRVVPPDAFYLVQSAFASTTKATSGKTLTLGALATLSSAAYAMSSAQSIMNVIFRTRETRPFWKSKLVAIVLTFAIFVLVFVSMLLLVLGNDITRIVANYWIFGPTATIIWKIIQICRRYSSCRWYFPLPITGGPTERNIDGDGSALAALSGLPDGWRSRSDSGCTCTFSIHMQ